MSSERPGADPSGGAPVSVRIADALADAEGVDPTDLSIRLEDYVNVEALRLLAAHDSDDWTVSFETGPYLVTVDGEGWVQVSDRPG